MEVSEAIKNRRAYRSLKAADVNESLITELATAASLSPSCFNNQPWRFVFVYEETTLHKVKEALSKGNDWAKKASMIIVVLSKESDDCILQDRKYNLFDTGMSVAFLILKATELGFVAHPIAGYDPLKVRGAINSPDNTQIISLIIFGIHNEKIDNSLSEKQKQDELQRPQRKPIEEIVCLNKYYTR